MDKGISSGTSLTPAVSPILSEPEALQALADIRLAAVHTGVLTAMVHCLADVFPWGQQSKLKHFTNIKFPRASSTSQDPFT